MSDNLSPDAQPGESSTSASSTAPRPQYGEYATPEQQAAAMGVRYQPIPTTPPPVAPIYGRAPTGRPAAAVQPRRWDSFFTWLLLAYGLYQVISGFIQYSNLAGVAQLFYAAEGFGTFHSQQPGLAATLGLVLNIVEPVLFVVVAAASVTLLRRGRLAVWVPVLGGVIGGILAAVCLMTLLFSDPSFATHLTKLSSGS